MWGQVATWSSVPWALLLAAISSVVCMAVANWRWPDRCVLEDPTPANPLPVPEVPQPPEPGHIVVTVEYRIDPSNADAFHELMMQSRSARLRQGAVAWDLLWDVNELGSFVEIIEDASWNDHLRRFQRVTAADVALRERKWAFHIGDHPPVVRRFLRKSTTKH